MVAAEVDLGIPGLGPATPFAQGGFAQVYRAEQLSLRRTVAVKVLFAPPADQMAYARFERECHSLGAVSNHPNIVVVHDRGVTADGRPYITMEYRAGGSLADRLAQRGSLPLTEIHQIGIKIADALAVAHDAGVIHRDVKPANILLSAYDEPALADFGIARIDGGHKTTSGQVSASVAHASREVLGGGEPTVQSDVYSLGSTLFELATGRTPFQQPGDASVWTVINRVMTAPPIDATMVGVPEPLAGVINRTLSHDLAVRQPDARVLRDELRSITIDGASVVEPQRAPANPLDQNGSDTATAPAATLLDLPGPNRPPIGQPGPSASPASPSPASPSPGPGWAAPPTVPAGPGSPTAPAEPPTGGRRGRRLRVLVGTFLVALLVGGGAAAALGPGSELWRGDDPSPELFFGRSRIGPLQSDETYVLDVRSAAPDSLYRLIVDGVAAGDEPNDLVLYRAEPGRHRLAVEVTEPAGTIHTTDEISVYVSPGPPQGGFRVNLAAVMAKRENWPTALEEFDELVADGHGELVLSLGANGEFWIFYIDGYGEDRDAAWEYCATYDLPSDECFAARVDNS